MFLCHKLAHQIEVSTWLHIKLPLTITVPAVDGAAGVPAVASTPEPAEQWFIYVRAATLGAS